MLIEQIDNFLDKDDLNKLISLPLNRVSKNEIKVYHNSIIGKKICRDIDEKITEIINNLLYFKLLVRLKIKTSKVL